MKKIISKRAGKVRDVYTLDSGELLMVASDRISVFDGGLPTPIPGKGKILNQISEFWFKYLDYPNHCITTNLDEMDIDWDSMGGKLSGTVDRAYCEGRSMLCRKVNVYPIEAIVRGHLVGSGWKEYQAKGTLCGEHLPEGIVQAGQLPKTTFTPSTKAEAGHDENISVARMQEILCDDQASGAIMINSIALYEKAYAYAFKRGIIIADTKFEWGWFDYGCNPDTGKAERAVILIDECLTPDSSRFWDVESYKPGTEPPSFDKDGVRRWAREQGYNGEGTPPIIPESLVGETQEKYIEVFRRLTGKEPVL
jgi:phosphoribosylaminoimidazole-succinocarboxamide synthase